MFLGLLMVGLLPLKIECELERINSVKIVKEAVRKRRNIRGKEYYVSVSEA